MNPKDIDLKTELGELERTFNPPESFDDLSTDPALSQLYTILTKADTDLSAPEYFGFSPVNCRDLSSSTMHTLIHMAWRWSSAPAADIKVCVSMPVDQNGSVVLGRKEACIRVGIALTFQEETMSSINVAEESFNLNPIFDIAQLAALILALYEDRKARLRSWFCPGFNSIGLGQRLGAGSHT